MGFLNFCHHFFIPTSSPEQDEKSNKHYDNIDEFDDHHYETVIVSKTKEILQVLYDPITLEMFVTPGIGTLDVEGNLIEEYARLAAKSLVGALNIVNKYAGLTT